MSELKPEHVSMAVAIFVMLFVLAFFAIAETSLNRISRVKAQAIADSRGTKAAQALLRLVTHPERFITPLLVTVTVLQMGQAFLTTLLANDLFGGWGVAVGFVLNVVVAGILTLILRAAKAPAGVDATQPADYFADEGDPRVTPMPPGAEELAAREAHR